MWGPWLHTKETESTSIHSTDTVWSAASRSCLGDFPTTRDCAVGLWTKVIPYLLVLLLWLYCHGSKQSGQHNSCSIQASFLVSLQLLMPEQPSLPTPQTPLWASLPILSEMFVLLRVLPGICAWCFIPSHSPSDWLQQSQIQILLTQCWFLDL